MNEYSGNYDSNLATSLPMWRGRIVSTESWKDNIESSHFTPPGKGWGYRYRVRIFNHHTGDAEDLPDDQLPMANVIMPVTAGSGLGGFVDTPSLSAGTIVWGFYADGMAGQEPYIIGVLINSNNNVSKEQPQGLTGAHQLFNDTYQGSVFVPDYLQLITPIESKFSDTFLPQQPLLTINDFR